MSFYTDQNWKHLQNNYSNLYCQNFFIDLYEIFSKNLSDIKEIFIQSLAILLILMFFPHRVYLFDFYEKE